jgi:DNA-binding CsgD family transcriptional regulator
VRLQLRYLGGTGIPGRTIASWKKAWGLTQARSNPVTPEEQELIKVMYLSGFSSLEIAGEIDRGKRTVNNHLKYMGFGDASKNKITEAQQLEVVEYKSQGYTEKEIASLVGVGTDSVHHILKAAGLTGDLHAKKYTRPELLAILKEAPYRYQAYFCGANGLPGFSTYVNEFGSWNGALEAAEIPHNKGSWKPDRPTIVYLIEFDGYYKIGVTQQTVKQRFGGYPEYQVLKTRSLELKRALDLEKTLLDVAEPYQYLHNDFPRGSGKTECFKMTPQELETLILPLFSN